MFSKLYIAVVMLIAAAVAVPANAAVITMAFSGVSNGGTGSGTLTFNDNGGSNSLTVTINNTSPNLLNSGSGQNSSIITGWGFSTTPNLPTVTSWSVMAGNVNLTSQYNFSRNVSLGGYQPGQLFLENSMQTTNGINGGIYNAAAPGNTANTYPDLAVFTLNFAAPFTLQQLDTATLRMQRVGSNGAGSLKLLGYVAEQHAAPEPDTILIVLTGLFVIFAIRSRRGRQIYGF